MILMPLMARFDLWTITVIKLVGRTVDGFITDTITNPPIVATGISPGESSAGVPWWNGVLYWRQGQGQELPFNGDLQRGRAIPTVEIKRIAAAVQGLITSAVSF